MQYRIRPSRVVDATLRVPGDKSISHRALMLGSIASGESEIHGFLAGADCLATLAAFEAMGVGIERRGETGVRIAGVGRDGLAGPAKPLDLGNSGTAMRLLAGLLAGQPFSAALTGDHSLSARPMQRVIAPLSAMGARIESRDGKPPLVVHGRRPLAAIDYAMPVASAQVKSAILLAGLNAEGETIVNEPQVTRDHTERMLRTLGVAVDRDGHRVAVRGGQELSGGRIDVPGDLSSAAFVLLATLLSASAEVVLRDVGVNPSRTGVLDILEQMGADVRIENPRNFGLEPVADLRVRASALSGIEVDPALVPLAIDEFPMLFVAAAAASGRTVFTGLGELRVKESDRIAAMADGLRALGIEVDETEDGAVVHGGKFRGGSVDSHGDHRIAMSLAVAGSVADGPVTVRDVDNVVTSFPGFPDLLAAMGIDIDVEGAAA